MAVLLSSLFHLTSQRDRSSVTALTPPTGMSPGRRIHQNSNAQQQQQCRFITNKLCPYAQKAWIALEGIGIDYRLEEVALYGGGSNAKPDWFWKLNPAGTVPVVVVHSNNNNSTAVYPDSDLILNAIENGSITGTRSITDHLQQQQQNDVNDAEEAVARWRKMINEQLIPIGKNAILYPTVQRHQQELSNVLTELDSMVVGPHYLVGGDHPSTADCHAFPFVWRLLQQRQQQSNSSGKRQDDGSTRNETPYPALSRWVHHCETTVPAFAKTVQQSWWWWW
jgi:glutathione S-transferase